MEHLNIDIHPHAEIQLLAFEWFDRIQLMQDLTMTLAFYSLILSSSIYTLFHMIQKNSAFKKTDKGVDITIDLDRSN
jgi:hypothetical protein